jgi:hypothetical protein
MICARRIFVYNIEFLSKVSFVFIKRIQLISFSLIHMILFGIGYVGLGSLLKLLCIVHLALRAMLELLTKKTTFSLFSRLEGAFKTNCVDEKGEGGREKA